MATNRHLSLLEKRVELLQDLLRRKKCTDLAYGCIQNIVAEGDGWSDWDDFIDHGRYAAIERNWYERTLNGLIRMGVEGILIDDLKRLETSAPRYQSNSLGSREASY